MLAKRHFFIATLAYAIPLAVLYPAIDGAPPATQEFLPTAVAIYIATVVGTGVYFGSELYKSAFNLQPDDRDENQDNFQKVHEYVSKSRFRGCCHFVLLFVMFCICYVGFAMNSLYWYETSRGVSGTTINVYGSGKVIVNKDPQNTSLWSAVDIAVPAEENVALFITTKRVTIDQTISNCGESKKILEAHCKNDSDCTAGDIYELGHGITTGNCLNGTCEIHGWCPVDPAEDEDCVTVEELDGVGKYTLHIRNQVHFDFAENKARNFDNSLNGTVCIHNDTEGKPCPIFPLEYIVRKAMNEELLTFPGHGATISIRLDYDCYEPLNTCSPKYNFTLLEGNSGGLRNYSYKDAVYPYDNKYSRKYIKATGLLFLVEVEANIKFVSPFKVLASTANVFMALQGTEQLTALFVFIVSVFYRFFCAEKILQKIQQKTSRRARHSDNQLFDRTLTQ